MGARGRRRQGARRGPRGLLAKLATTAISPDYAAAFRLWKGSFLSPNDRVFELPLASRLLVGHGNLSGTDVGLTVHHARYYESPEEHFPNDYDAPRPVAFLTVRPNTRFQFALSGPAGWISFGAAGALVQGSFARAGMSLEDEVNMVYLKGHWGPHPALYHQEVYRRLLASLDTCTSASTCRLSLESALRKLAADICTPGSVLNLMIAKH